MDELTGLLDKWEDQRWMPRNPIEMGVVVFY